MASVRLLGSGGRRSGEAGWTWPSAPPTAPQSPPVARTPSRDTAPAAQPTTPQAPAQGSAWPTTWGGGINPMTADAPSAPPAPQGQATLPGPVDGNYKDWFLNLVTKTRGGRPADTQQALPSMKGLLEQHGFQVSPPNAAGETTKIYVPGQGWTRVIEGAGPSASWTWVPQGAGGGSSMPWAGGIGNQGVPDILQNYQNQFDDPSTQQLEQLIQAQLAALEEQRGRQARVDPYFRGQIQGAQQKTADLLAFLQQRAARLQEDPYTGSEWEVLRTRALDPIEADRQAAQQRVRGRIGNAGYDPTSGIAQDLMNQVDAGYDRNRAAAQNDLAYRSIQESRSREQEAQALLAMLPEIQRAGVGGDLGLMQMLDAALNLPRQQALPLASLQQDLPNRAMQQALAAMGMGPSPSDLFQQAMQMYQVGQQNQNNWWGSLGQTMPWLFQGLQPGAMDGATPPGMLGGWGAGSF